MVLKEVEGNIDNKIKYIDKRTMELGYTLKWRHWVYISRLYCCYKIKYGTEGATQRIVHYNSLLQDKLEMEQLRAIVLEAEEQNLKYIIDDYSFYLPLKQIDKLNMSADKVSIKEHKGYKRREREQKKQEAHQMLKEGLRLYDVAAILDIEYNTLQVWRSEWDDIPKYLKLQDAKPWEEEGISHRTYYRRKEKGYIGVIQPKERAKYGSKVKAKDANKIAEN